MSKPSFITPRVVIISLVGFVLIYLILFIVLPLVAACISKEEEDIPLANHEPMISATTIATALSNWMSVNPNHPITENIHGISWDEYQIVTISMAEYKEEQVELFRETFDVFFQNAWHLIVFERSDGVYLPADP